MYENAFQCFSEGIGLAWGPGHGASAEEVDVEVVDGLAAVGAGVDDEAVAAGEALPLGDLGGGGDELAQEGAVFCFGVGGRGEVLFRDDEDVGGGLRVKVGDGDGGFVLVEAGD